jgi:hypothetical protein
MVTREQLASVLDIDLWRSAEPGRDEQFDVDRFGLWLEVLLDSGATYAARRIAEIDADLVTTAFAQHILVFDGAAVLPAPGSDGEDGEGNNPFGDELTCQLGGYLIVSRRAGPWDAVVATLVALDSDHPDYFHRVMAGCRGLSNSAPEVDGLDDLLGAPKQTLFNLASDREQRREREGYVTAAHARAFLQMARELRTDTEAPPDGNPVARAYFRSIGWATPEDVNSGDDHAAPAAVRSAPSDEPGVSAIVEVLRESGVLPDQPRALLSGSRAQTERLALIQAQMQFAREQDETAYSMRTQELAYLANTLVAGCAVQSRRFELQEASDAAAAVCNLGLQNWPRHWFSSSASHGTSDGESGAALNDDFLLGHDLVTVFQVGWAVLHREVAMYTAERLTAALKRVRGHERHIQADLDALRIEMTKQWHAATPWRARDLLDAIASLDMPTWAALVGLLDECPVLHGGVGASRASGTRAVSATAFEFISENSQIAAIHAFLHSLPEALRG